MRALVSSLLSAAILATLWIAYAEYLVFHRNDHWPSWVLFATGFMPFLSFLALLPAAILPRTTKGSLIAVSAATLLALLIEVSEVIFRSNFVDPFGAGASEYGRQVVTSLLLPATISVFLGALVRRHRTSAMRS